MNRKEKRSKQKNMIDISSKFLCTVYKPLYYIVLPLVLALELEIFTLFSITENTNLVYWIIIGVIFLTAIIEYFVCKKIRVKNNTLDVKQLTFGKKVKHILIILSVTFIFMIIIPFMHVYIISNL